MNDPMQWVATTQPMTNNCTICAITDIYGRGTYPSDLSYKNYVEHVWDLMRRTPSETYVMKDANTGKRFKVKNTTADLDSA